MKENLGLPEAIAHVTDNGKRVGERVKLDPFRQENGWFSDTSCEKHDPAHQARVLVLVSALFDMSVPEEVEFNGLNKSQLKEAVLWTAATHDLKTNGSDGYEEHGIRAAEWIGTNLSEKIDPEVMPVVQALCMLHVPEDRDLSKMTDSLKMLLNVFKDADALDRVRFDNGDSLKSDYLRISESREWFIVIAEELFRRTNEDYSSAETAFNEVIKAAVEMNLVS